MCQIDRVGDSFLLKPPRFTTWTHYSSNCCHVKVDGKSIVLGPTPNLKVHSESHEYPVYIAERRETKTRPHYKTKIILLHETPNKYQDTTKVQDGYRKHSYMPSPCSLKRPNITHRLPTIFYNITLMKIITVPNIHTGTVSLHVRV